MTDAASLLTTYETPTNQRPRQAPNPGALTTYETPTNQQPRQAPNPGAQLRIATTTESSAHTFAQRSTLTYAQRVVASVAGTNGVLHPGILC